MWPAVFIIALILLPFLLRHWGWNNWEIGAPYEGTHPVVVERMLRLTELKKGDVFYDLGSGDGRLVIAAALKGAKAVGVEKDKIRAWYSGMWLRMLGIKNAKIICKDIFDVDLSRADIVSVFLTNEGNERIKAKLKEELKKGSLVVSNGFKFKGWKHTKIDPRGTVYGPVYLYKI